MKFLLLVLSAFLVSSAFGQTALHEIRFTDGKFVSFIEPKKYEVYSLSERAKPMMQKSTGRKIVAANYITGIKIKTENPDAAAQMILGQIADATESKLGPFWNSRLKEAKPATILTGIGKNSVWSIFISPADRGDYTVTISYIIEE